MPVLLQIPENPNCEPLDGQVFQCRGASREVTHAPGIAIEEQVMAGAVSSSQPMPPLALIVEQGAPVNSSLAFPALPPS